MARAPQTSDFLVEVPNIGSFTFGRRTMRDEMKIQVEYARMIEGVEPTEWLSQVGGWLSTLGVLTVRAPDDWDVSAMDPLDDEVYAKMAIVYAALREKEDSFRKKPRVGSEEGGAGSV